MKTKIYLLIFFLFPIFYGQCASEKKQSEICDEAIINILRCINEFYFDSLPSHLDSALLYIDEIDGKCEKYKTHIAFHKAHIYFLKGEILIAIDIFESLDSVVFPYPLFKNIIINKLKGKEAELKGDMQQRNFYYKNIVNVYEKQIALNKNEFDSIVRLPDVASIREGVGFYMNEMYYYKAKIEGMDKVILEIDSLQKAVNGNEEYFEEFKKYLRNEEGYSMRVMFE